MLAMKDPPPPLVMGTADVAKTADDGWAAAAAAHLCPLGETNLLLTEQTGGRLAMVATVAGTRAALGGVDETVSKEAPGMVGGWMVAAANGAAVNFWLVIKERVVGEMGPDKLIP